MMSERYRGHKALSAEEAEDVLKKRKKPVQEKSEAATRGKYSSLTNEAAESVLTGKQQRVAATGEVVSHYDDTVKMDRMVLDDTQPVPEILPLGVLEEEDEVTTRFQKMNEVDADDTFIDLSINQDPYAQYVDKMDQVELGKVSQEGKRLPAFPKHLNAEYERRKALEKWQKDTANDRSVQNLETVDDLDITVEIPSAASGVRKRVDLEKVKMTQKPLAPETSDVYQMRKARTELLNEVSGNERFTLAEAAKRYASDAARKVIDIDTRIHFLSDQLMKAKVKIEPSFGSVISGMPVSKMANPATRELPEVKQWMGTLSDDRKIEVLKLMEQMTEYERALNTLAPPYKEMRLQYTKYKQLAEVLDDPEATLSDEQEKMLFDMASDMRSAAIYEAKRAQNAKTLKEQAHALGRRDDAFRLAEDLEKGLIPYDLMNEPKSADADVFEDDEDDVDAKVV